MIVKTPYKKVSCSLDDILVNSKTYKANYDIDIGCGFNLTYFERPFDIDVIKGYCSSFVCSSISYQHYSFEEYCNIFDNFNLVAKYEFLKNQYKQFCKIFGGNHFIEYGYTSDKKWYVLIHSGSNGIAKNFYNHNYEDVYNFCKSYAHINRSIIANFMIKRNDSFIWTFDQPHNILYKNKFLLGYSKLDKDNGNIFTAGPKNKSLIIEYTGTPSEDLIIKHGCDTWNQISKSFKNRSIKEIENYSKDFVPVNNYDFSNFKIKRTLNPIFSKRPKNVH